MMFYQMFSVNCVSWCGEPVPGGTAPIRVAKSGMADIG